MRQSENFQLRSPYPWFGGKSIIMHEVWRRLGDTYNFVDPFFGSNAPLLSRGKWDAGGGAWADGRNRIETVNDKDCFVANFWRALNDKPDEVARWANWPVNEADLHARHLWLVNNEDFIDRMKSNPDYYDAKIAGWWIWGLCQWIGSGWCDRPSQQLPHLGDAGRGIHRPSQKLPHLGDAGMGVHRPSQQLPHLGDAGMGDIYEYFNFLAARLRRVRVCCGDWSRVLGPTPTEKHGMTAIILDPPYGDKAKRTRVYSEDSFIVADTVREWAIENGDNPQLRIALFGYADEHTSKMSSDWECLAWKAKGGYSSQGTGNDNPHKERVWFSPHCLKVEAQQQLRMEI